MGVTFDDVQEGAALPAVTRRTTHAGILKFMGATWMWSEQFFHDAEVAQRMGLPGPIIPGPYKHALLQQYVLHWIGGEGRLRRLQVSHRRPDPHDGVLTLGGAVTRRYERDGARLADLELWIDQESGERSVRGSATVEF